MSVQYYSDNDFIIRIFDFITRSDAMRMTCNIPDGYNLVILDNLQSKTIYKTETTN